MNVNVHTDSYVNKDCSGLNYRNCVACCCTRLMLYSHLDNNDDDDKIIIIIIVATIIAIYASLNLIKIIKKRGRHVYK
jgi:hypothetical protein